MSSLSILTALEGRKSSSELDEPIVELKVVEDDGTLRNRRTLARVAQALYDMKSGDIPAKITEVSFAFRENDLPIRPRLRLVPDRGDK